MPKKTSIARRKKILKKRRTKIHPLINKIIGLIFLILTFVILFLPQIFFSPQINNNDPIKISPLLLVSKAKENDPIRILIPQVSIDLKVTDAKITNGYWELSENTASYGLGSGQPGTKGNTVIFAHARQGLFYNLKNVKENDIIYVFTKKNWFRYKIYKISAVYPNQTEIIKPTKKEVLTLYTCTGFYDEKRLIVQALPEN